MLVEKLGDLLGMIKLKVPEKRTQFEEAISEQE